MESLEPVYFYFQLPIYSVIKIDPTNVNDFWSLIKFRERVNYYNPNLKENSTFTVIPCCYNNFENFSKYGGMNYSRLDCVRTGQNFYFYYYYDTKKSEFMKIGQFPSIADFHISQIKKYDKVISKEKLREFTRAIGLAANGVGIGSFVYLRRIFEELMEESHSIAKTQSDWDEKKYNTQRIPEKIELLKEHLPTFLIKNKSLYSILSTGIHNLSEDECLSYFDIVKLGIELILDEKVDQLDKLKKIQDAEKSISTIKGKIQKA